GGAGRAAGGAGAGCDWVGTGFLACVSGPSLWDRGARRTSAARAGPPRRASWEFSQACGFSQENTTVGSRLVARKHREDENSRRGDLSVASRTRVFGRREG